MKNNNIKIKIPEYAEKAIDTLRVNGFEAFVVGGCVRDSIMGKKPNDWDLCTSSYPEETIEVFKDFRCIETGIKHGTLTVIIDSVPVEITSFRTDGEYSDHRRPDSVSFSRSIHDDLSRRDFTVNAMAYNHESGLIDDFGGLGDIEAELLKCVGKPRERFTEDALRILRCLRFASTLGFSIEAETEASVLNLKNSLCFVSPERINQEFTKFICGQNAAELCERYRDILAVFIPELKNIFELSQNCPYHCFDVYKHSVEALRHCESDKELRLAALFHDLGKYDCKTSDKGRDHFYGHEKVSAEKTDAIMKRLRYDNETRENTVSLIRHHMEPLPMPEIRVKRLLAKLGDAMFEKLIALEKADNSAIKPQYISQRMREADEALEAAKKLRAADDCLSLKSLKIDGDILCGLGYKPGKAMGKELEALLEAVMRNQIPNEPEALVLRAKADFKSV